MGRGLRFLNAFAVVALLAAGGSARAELNKNGSVVGNAFEEGHTRGGLLNGNIKRFGVPDPTTGAIGAPRVGGVVEGSLAQGTLVAGPCEITGKLGSASAELSAGIGVDKDVTTGTTLKGMHGGHETGKGAGGLGAGGLVQCNAAVEVTAVSVEAECKGALGTIKPSVKLAGADAGCSCARGCVAEAYWAKAGVEYKTPPIGGCGIKVSGTAGAEVMAGVAAGVEKVGDVGAGIKLGPVGVKLGVSVEEFDLGKTKDCLVDAAKFAGEQLAKVGDMAVDLGKKALGGLSDAGKAVGGFFSGLFGGGGGGGGRSLPPMMPWTSPYGYTPAYAYGTNVSRLSMTLPTGPSVYSNGTLGNGQGFGIHH